MKARAQPTAFGAQPGAQPATHGARRAGGYALVVVLLVLLALLVLATPFLSMARNADRASAQSFDRAEARMALDVAGRHGRLLLSGSHPSVDGTPYFDGEDELAVDNRFPEGFYDANDPRGVMWDVDALDLAGRIDLNSAGPFVLANVAGLVSRTTRPVEAEDRTLPAASGAGFAPAGYLWLAGEHVRHGAFEDGAFVDLLRGLGADEDAEERGGPRPASAHGLGTAFFDQRALAPILWRLGAGTGELRSFQSAEELALADPFCHAAGDDDAGTPSFEPELLDLWQRACTVHADVRGGRPWRRAARLTSPVEGGRDGVLQLDDVRHVNPGATLRIEDQDDVELALVQRIEGRSVFLDHVLEASFEAYAAEVRVLVRRAVNANTAPAAVLEALFANLQLSGRNERVTSAEARSLAALVVASRPFEGHEDFLRRVVLPAAGLEELPADAPFVPEGLAGGAFLDPDDALAVYANALDANDGGLSVSTMPLCFTSRDVFQLDLRATVNGASGVERASARREDVALIVPQQELVALWARQEDFDESFRLDGEAPWWATGPAATSRWDAGTTPPTRLWAHLGTFDGQPFLPGVTPELETQDPGAPAVAEHVFASREETGWAAAWPARVAETDALAGRVLHFDHETRDAEGRYLADAVVARASDDPLVGWADTGGDALLRPLSGSLWVKPQALADQVLLDVGGDLFTDRVSLALEGEDLVLRVLDGPGDHRETTAFVEAGELRLALAPGDGPGLPLDTWSHVAFDVRGNRPDQMTLLVNGLGHGVRARGLTRLTSSIDETATTLPVESTEGFPDGPCVVRIGEELIECVVADGQSFVAQHETSGARAGFGGRLARLQHAENASGSVPVGAVDANHAAGTPVELYGYSAPLAAGGAPGGRADLAVDLSAFRAARVAGVSGTGAHSSGAAIRLNGLFWEGIGIEGDGTDYLLSLDSADAFGEELPVEDFMGCFDRAGGYAALVQVDTGLSTVQGSPLGGVEIVRYSTWTVEGDDRPVLHLAARGGTLAGELAQYGGSSISSVGGTRAFVFDWTTLYYSEAGSLVPIRDDRRFDWYVVPVSLRVPGVSTLGFLPVAAGAGSEFAQITHVDDAELTEWVRYDTLAAAFEQLVRDDPIALGMLLDEASDGLSGITLRDKPEDEEGFGAGAPPAEPALAPPTTVAATKAAPTATAPAAQDPPSDGDWYPTLGEEEQDAETFAHSRAFNDALQFRGVLATFDHPHPTGTPVVPVFSVPDRGPAGGRPGRLDEIFALAGDPTHVGWPVIVHRAHIPSDTVVRTSYDAALETWSSSVVPQVGFDDELVRIALQDRIPEPIAAGMVNPPSGTQPVQFDARLVGRLSAFPSGERPRIAASVVLGSDSTGATAPATAVVDEVVFGDARFGQAGPVPPVTAGLQLVLEEDIDEASDRLSVDPNVGLIAGGRAGYQGLLAGLPADAGLLRIGEEVLAYDTRDDSTGELTVARGGRGLLGTRAQSHARGEPVTFLEAWPTSELTGELGAEDGVLLLEDLDGFPESGTVLVGDELVHYTAHFEGGLWMPRRSSVPGALDARGEGLFRGRFGTQPAGHSVGEAVVLFPFRYWDRWAERADAPELGYLALAVDQPAAFVRSVFWMAEEAGGGARVAVLQRTDLAQPWDEDPDEAEGLELLEIGTHEGGPLAVGAQCDRVEWRVHVVYPPGAFDLATGLAHGWKQTPRLTRFGAFYLAPSLTLGSVER